MSAVKLAFFLYMCPEKNKKKCDLLSKWEWRIEMVECNSNNDEIVLEFDESRTKRKPEVCLVKFSRDASEIRSIW